MAWHDVTFQLEDEEYAILLAQARREKSIPGVIVLRATWQYLFPVVVPHLAVAADLLPGGVGGDASTHEP